jgi:hypothetical protein
MTSAHQAQRRSDALIPFAEGIQPRKERTHADRMEDEANHRCACQPSARSPSLRRDAAASTQGTGSRGSSNPGLMSGLLVRGGCRAEPGRAECRLGRSVPRPAPSAIRKRGIVRGQSRHARGGPSEPARRPVGPSGLRAGPPSCLIAPLCLPTRFLYGGGGGGTRRPRSVWGHGRLPRWASGSSSTAGAVQAAGAAAAKRARKHHGSCCSRAAP